MCGERGVLGVGCVFFLGEEEGGVVWVGRVDLGRGGGVVVGRGGGLAEYRRPPKHCICLHHVHDHVSHQHAYEVWNDFATFCLYTLKSGDKLISLKETYGSCEGRAEQHLLHHGETEGTCNVE